jgi:hypothetical protein
MTRLFRQRAAALCARLSCVLACAVAPLAAPASASSSLPSPAQLAEQVFPGWSDNHAGRVQTVTLPGGTGASYANWGSGPTRVIVDPKLVLRIDAEHVTLLVAMLPAGDDGKPAVTHLTPMGLAAYQFEKGANGWNVAGRQGVFAWRGFFGTANLRPVALATRRQGIGVEYGSCWEGYCGTWLALYELDRGVVRREPAVEMALSGTDIDGATDCLRRLQPLIKPRPQDPAARDDASPPASHDCYMIDSSWSVEPARDQPGDLIIHYQGAMSRADAHAAPPTAIDQRQVLRYGSGKYRAVSGFNPVPPI